MSDVVDASDLEEVCNRAGRILRDGGLVVAPSDTVYAVLADAFQPDATARLRDVRQTGRTPTPVLVRSPRQVNGLVTEVPEVAERLMAAWWPGPLTIILTVSHGLAWDLGDDGGTVSLRMPADEVLLALVGEVGPLACTSASIQGSAPATDIATSRAQLGDGVALYIDGGTREGTVSTVVDCTRDGAHTLRVGAVSAEAVEAVASGRTPWGAQPTPSELAAAREPATNNDAHDDDPPHTGA